MLANDILAPIGQSMAEQLWALQAPHGAQAMAHDASWNEELSEIMENTISSATPEDALAIGFCSSERACELAAIELVDFSLSGDARLQTFLKWHQISRLAWLSGSGHPEYWLLRKTHDYIHGPSPQDFKPSRFDRLPTHGLHHLAFGLNPSQTYDFEATHKERLALVSALSPLLNDLELAFVARYAADPRVRRGDTSWLEMPSRQSLSNWVAARPQSYADIESFFNKHPSKAWFSCATRGCGSAKIAATLAQTGRWTQALEIILADSTTGLSSWRDSQSKSWKNACSEWTDRPWGALPPKAAIGHAECPALSILAPSERLELAKSIHAEINANARLEGAAFERLLFWLAFPDRALGAGARERDPQASHAFALRAHELSWAAIDPARHGYLAALADRAISDWCTAHSIG